MSRLVRIALHDPISDPLGSQISNERLSIHSNSMELAPSFWFETDEAVQIFTRTKGPFVDVSFSDSHETAAYYSPTHNDHPGLMIREDQELQSFDLLHITEKQGH